jgi:hypothetical protein
MRLDYLKLPTSLGEKKWPNSLSNLIIGATGRNPSTQPHQVADTCKLSLLMLTVFSSNPHQATVPGMNSRFSSSG